MLDQEFCNFLEYELTKAFANCVNERARSFWCDGILLPAFEHQYSKKFVNDNRQIIMTAYIGSLGDNQYELTLKFGKKALSKYARDLDIYECIPNPENSNWIDIDIERKIISIQLD